MPPATSSPLIATVRAVIIIAVLAALGLAVRACTADDDAVVDANRPATVSQPNYTQPGSGTVASAPAAEPEVSAEPAPSPTNDYPLEQVSGLPEASASAAAVMAAMYGAEGADQPSADAWTTQVRPLSTDAGYAQLVGEGSGGGDLNRTEAITNGWSVKTDTSCDVVPDAGATDAQMVLNCSSVVRTVGADGSQVAKDALGLWPYDGTFGHRMTMTRQGQNWLFDGFVQDAG